MKISFFIYTILIYAHFFRNTTGTSKELAATLEIPPLTVVIKQWRCCWVWPYVCCIIVRETR